MEVIWSRAPEYGKDFVWRKIVCAWCGELIRRVPDFSGNYFEDYESHGICKKCDQIHFGDIKL
jgi:hypothetical protein